MKLFYWDCLKQNGFWINKIIWIVWKLLECCFVLGFFFRVIAMIDLHIFQESAPVRCLSFHPSGDYILVGTQHPVCKFFWLFFTRLKVHRLMSYLLLMTFFDQWASSTATPMEKVCGPKGGLCWKINLI